MIRIRPRAYLELFLSCGPVWKINTLHNDEVYRSESNLICINEMCVDIKLGAFQNIEQI